MDSENPAEVVEIAYKDTYALRESVLWPGRPDLAALACDAEGRHFGVRLRGELQSVISLFVSEDGQKAQFRKFATASEHQGQGLGSLLLQHLIQEARKQGVQRLWCDARATQVGFYERRGMQPADGGAIFLKNGKEYVRLEMQL